MKALLLLASLLCATAGWAVKMHPAARTVTQADGTTLSVRGIGDEDFSYFVTVDGVLLFQDGTDFYVAKVCDDGTLATTGVLAHEAALRTDEEKALAKAQDTSLFYANIVANADKGRKMREPMAANSTLLTSIGSPRVPVLLVEFSDTTFSVADPKATFDKYLNADELFDSASDPELGSNYGSVKRYFSDMSFGLFTPQFDVYGPVTLGNPLSYYGRGNSASENMTDLFNHACQALDDEVDFSQYDSNGDGYIDLVYIIYAGYSQSIAGNSTDCIYPKSGTLSAGGTFDGVRLMRYGVNNELNATPAERAEYGLLINGIGLFCHEFSHCMGLPDFYPTASGLVQRCVNQNLDYYSLMDAGEYCYNGYRPTEYTAWERERLGWLTIDTLEQPASVTLEPLSQGGKAYRILNDNDDSGHEYYIVENVQKTGWNRYLLGHGMLVFHVDYDEQAFSLTSNSVNNIAGHPRMSIIAADGLFLPETILYTTVTEPADEQEQEINQVLLERYAGEYISYSIYTAEAAGDPFPGTSAATELTDDSHPAATVFQGGLMGKPITDIVEDTEAGTVSFSFMGGVSSGISAPCMEAEDERIFSIDGRYLGTDKSRLDKGLYIIGGRKVVL